MYIINDLPKNTKNDFARLRISECLIPQVIGEFMKEDGGDRFINYIIDHKLNCGKDKDKFITKLKASILFIDRDEISMESNT